MGLLLEGTRDERWDAAWTVFTPVGRQVIALTAGSPRECKACHQGDGWFRRLGAFILHALALDGPAPLANERLEALRRLACASFATAGRPGEQSVAAALDAGLSPRQIEQLGRLAGR